MNKVNKKYVFAVLIFIAGWPLWAALAIILALSYGVCSLADYLFTKYTEKYL